MKYFLISTLIQYVQKSSLLYAYFQKSKYYMNFTLNDKEVQTWQAIAMTTIDINGLYEYQIMSVRSGRKKHGA